METATIKPWFSDTDVWNLGGFLLKLIPDAIEHLSEISHGWPQSEEFQTFESWECFLLNLAKDFRTANDLIYFGDSDEGFKLLKECSGGIKSFKEDYLAVTKERRERGVKLLKDCFNRFSDNVEGFWD